MTPAAPAEVLGGRIERGVADRIEAGTFMAGVALAGGRVRLTGVDTTHVGPITAVLREMGCDITEEGDTLTIFVFNGPAATVLYTATHSLSLLDALPICFLLFGNLAADLMLYAADPRISKEAR